MSIFGGRRQQPPDPDPNPSKTGTHVSSGTKTPNLQAPRQPVGFETVLGANSTLRGDLKSQANVRLDGTFEGNLEIEGNVLVGETGKVNADIHARNVVIAGAVRGNVSGNKVQLLRTSRVWGDIHAAAITTEEGAFIDGKITMIRHDASLQSFEADMLPILEVGEKSIKVTQSASIETAELDVVKTQDINELEDIEDPY